MKREIKFRVWSHDAKKFRSRIFVLTSNGLLMQVEHSDDCMFLTFPQESVQFAGLYTGLKDKNGKEIYEGDIMQSGKGKNFTVIFSKTKHKWSVALSHYPPNWSDRKRYKSMEWALENCEIIGNIYENPELLNKKDDE